MHKDHQISPRHVPVITLGVAVVAASAVVAFFALRGPPLVGTWVSESQIVDAPLGSLRVQVNSDGTGLLLVKDRIWVYDGFQYRVANRHIVVRLGLPGEVQSKGEMTFAYSLENGRLSLNAADEETKKLFPRLIRFRKVAAQLKHKR